MRKALDSLQRILKERLSPHETEEASRCLQEISKRGELKVEGALANPDKAAAKEALRKLATEYAGTDAGKRAVDLVK